MGKAQLTEPSRATEIVDVQEQQSAQKAGVRQQAVQSLKWTGLSSVLLRIYQPLIAIILARLLAPADFGLVGFANIVISVLLIFGDLGLNAALIQRKDDANDQVLNTVFYSNLALGVVWFVLAFGLAPVVAGFFEQPQVTWILRVMALSFLITPWGSVQRAMLVRGLDFRRLFWVDLSAIIVQGLLSVGLAAVGVGVWALVYGSLVRSGITAVLLWKSLPWRPQRSFRWQILRQMTGFGVNVSLDTFLGWIVGQVDGILVGKRLGATALGLYRQGIHLGMFPVFTIMSVGSTLIYTTYSKLQDTRDVLRNTHLDVLKYLSLIGFPVCVGMFILAHDLVLMVYGERWADMIPVVRFVMGYTLIGMLNSPLLELYKALGRPDIRLKYSVVRGVGTLIAFLIGINYGLAGMAIAHSCSALLFGPINFYISMRLLNISVTDILKVLWAPGFAALCMALAATAVQSVTVIGGELNGWTGLMVNSGTMGLVYVLALSIFSPTLLRDAKRFGWAVIYTRGVQNAG